MNDFTRENRNSGWWSTDCRRAVNGETIAVILEKQGKRERPPVENLTDRRQEAMRLGLVMQPVVARMWEDEHGIRLKEFDVELTHPTEKWMKSHFDYISEDGKILVECKNYNAMAEKKFSDPGEPMRIPDADMAQCIHEACVANVDIVYLAVLFGGQAFRSFRIDVTEEMKLHHIQTYAPLWANVVQGTLPDTKSTEDARLAYPQHVENWIMADQHVELMVASYTEIKRERKKLEEKEEIIEARLMALMGNNSEIRAVDGSTIVTWRTAKSSKRFDTDLLKAEMPDIFKRFQIEKPGSRRLLVK